MYSSILVVGGGLMFHKAQEFLQHRILNKMPPSFRRIIENVDVITRPKDMDPRLISWKGVQCWRVWTPLRNCGFTSESGNALVSECYGNELPLCGENHNHVSGHKDLKSVCILSY